MGQADVGTPIVVDHGGVAFVVGNLSELAPLMPMGEGKLKDSLFLSVATDFIVPCFEKLPRTIVPQERLLLVSKAICKAWRNGKRDEALENALTQKWINGNLLKFTELMAAG